MNRRIAVTAILINLISAAAYVADSFAEDLDVSRIEVVDSLPLAPINGGVPFFLELDPPIQFPNFKFTEIQLVSVEYPLYIFGIHGRLTDNDSASTTMHGTCEWRSEIELLSCDLSFGNFILNVLTDINLNGSIQICDVSTPACVTTVETSRSSPADASRLYRDSTISAQLCRSNAAPCSSTVRPRPLINH